MRVSTKDRETAVTSRLVKGDTFFHGADLVEVTGHPERIDEDFVKVPVLVDGAARTSRRKMNAHTRVRLIK